MNEVEMQPDPVDYGEWKSGVNTNIATIVTMMFYDLDKIYPQIVKELDERRANA